MTYGPGTVSKIVWHFAGGPKWDDATNSRAPKPKSDEEAYTVLAGILSERQLKVSTYPEVVKLITKLGTTSVFITKRQTSQVCCVSEIPIQHLTYHAQHYGRFAIGFYRDSALEAGFRPVVYALEDDWVVHEIEKAYVRILARHPQTSFKTPAFEDHPEDTERDKKEKKDFKSWYTQLTDF